MNGKTYFPHFVLGLIAVLFVIACREQNLTESKTVGEWVFHEKLSDYEFFTGKMSELVPAEGVLPYELNTPLFTDYAQKARFIKLPEGHSMDLVEGELDFPNQTVLIKNFYYYDDEQHPEKGKRLIETRLLVKQGENWEVGNYEWNDEQTEAKRNILGGKKVVNWVNKNGVAREITYVIPDNNDCKSCHKKDGYVIPIGPKIKNLNKNVEDGNQLENWQKKGFIARSVSLISLPQLPVWNDPRTGNLVNRARAYLDVNCAHCHSQNGPASNTGLFLDYEEASANRIGILKGPVSAAQGSGNLMYNIVPGDASASIMAYRMGSAETGIAMPEVGKTIVHEEGVALITEWINGMGE